MTRTFFVRYNEPMYSTLLDSSTSDSITLLVEGLASDSANPDPMIKSISWHDNHNESYFAVEYYPDAAHT